MSDIGFGRHSEDYAAYRLLEEHMHTTASTIFPDVEGLGRFLQ